MPLSTFHIALNISPDKYNIEEIHPEKENTYAKSKELINIQENVMPKPDNDWNIASLLILTYMIGLLFLVLRLLINFLKIIYSYSSCEKIKQDNVTFLLNNKIESPYTFFRWIFIPGNWLNDNENKDILTHERIHASQYHSIDLILIELLSAVMWFNPLVWMMKKSVQLVHEYLADEGVLNTGTDKLRYQALLINQVAEERLICLSSSFNHSLIKKRMIMMTKSKFNKGSKLRILTLIPLAAMLFVGVAFVNGQEVDKNSKVFTVIIDAGHGGKDVGAKLNDKIIEKDITLSIAKILKEKSSANTKLNLIFTREKDEFLELNKRIASDADLLISIHANFVENTDVSGIECFVAKESEFKEKSETFGKLIVTELNQLNGIKTTTSVNEADFFILKESQCPAILLIIGYLSNPDDLSFINDKSNQGLICDKILTAISQ
jgi:N-acetylmuramoyl-L-alanine amidase